MHSNAARGTPYSFKFVISDNSLCPHSLRRGSTKFINMPKSHSPFAWSLCYFSRPFTTKPRSEILDLDNLFPILHWALYTLRNFVPTRGHTHKEVKNTRASCSAKNVYPQSIWAKGWLSSWMAFVVLWHWQHWYMHAQHNVAISSPFSYILHTKSQRSPY